MYPIEPLLPIFEGMDGAALSPQAFAELCAASGWGAPVDDGIGLWEATHPLSGTPLILDTVTRPTTLLCRLDSHDDYEPEALLEGPLRRAFDQNFLAAAEMLGSRFPRSLASGTYEPPFQWRFAHFQGLNSIVALEQSYYDPILGVQLLLLLQPLPAEPVRSAITAGW